MIAATAITNVRVFDGERLREPAKVSQLDDLTTPYQVAHGESLHEELERLVDAGLAQYVALAEALHVPLITADARIKRSGVARCKVEVFDAHT